MTKNELAAAIRAKFPGSYDGVDDNALVEAWIRKYPEYESQISDRYKQVPSGPIPADQQPPLERPSTAGFIKNVGTSAVNTAKNLVTGIPTLALKAVDDFGGAANDLVDSLAMRAKQVYNDPLGTAYNDPVGLATDVAGIASIAKSGLRGARGIAGKMGGAAPAAAEAGDAAAAVGRATTTGGIPVARGLVPSGGVGGPATSTMGAGWKVTVPESMKRPGPTGPQPRLVTNPTRLSMEDQIANALQEGMKQQSSTDKVSLPTHAGPEANKAGWAKGADGKATFSSDAAGLRHDTALAKASKQSNRQSGPESGSQPQSVTGTHGGGAATVEESLGVDQSGAGDVVTEGTTAGGPAMPGTPADTPAVPKYDRRRKSFAKTMKQTDDEMNWESGLEPGTPEARSASSLHRDMAGMDRDYRRRISDERGMISPDLLLGMFLEEGLRKVVKNPVLRAGVKPAVQAVGRGVSAIAPSREAMWELSNVGRYGADEEQ